MGEKEALRIIIISLHCTNPSLPCANCPAYVEGKDCKNTISNATYDEAVSVLSEKLKSM